MLTDTSGALQERRREAVRALEAETKHPLVLVDTATANWQVLHASEIARERIGCLPAGYQLGGLWDHIAVQSEKQVTRTFIPPNEMHIHCLYACDGLQACRWHA
jgi:hypothetical protein